ncbi:MAG: glycosyl transferase family 1, partial [Flavobacteriales bacterium]
MPKVLVFTYHWPPAAGPGVQRMLKFCKFLPSFGWEPTVITVKNAAFSSLDDSLADDVSESIVVHKTKTFEPFALYNLLKGKKGKHVPMGLIGLQNSKSLFQRISIYLRANYFIPDARKGWNKYAIAKADELFKKEKFDAIITTGPPHSTHLIGLHLNKKYGIPWVADLRDPWTNVYYNKFFPRTENTCKKDKKLEDSVVQNADLVTVVSDGLKDEFQSRAKNIAVIYNGYDDEDLHAEQQEKTTEKFTLAYVGNLKPNQNVPALWEVIRAAAAENEEFASNFQLNFTGNADDSVVESVQQQQLQEMLTRKGYVPHKEA